MRKINLITLATAAVSLAFAGAANATSILTYGSANPVNVTFDGTTLDLNDSNSTVQSKLGFGVATGQNVTFTGLTASSFATTLTSFDETLTGGTFNIGSGLLTGSFSSADLTGALSSNVGFIAFNSVVYTGGTWLPSNFSDTLGTALSTEFNLPSSTTWAEFVSSTAVGKFSGSDATTASGTVVAGVPEPASVVTFGMGAIALMLMAGAARRRNAGAQL